MPRRSGCRGRQRVAALGVVDHQRHRAGKQCADSLQRPRAEPADHLAHHQRREVHDRGRLAVVAALDRVDALDRRRVERIAAQPVEPIGGEQNDPAPADASLERPSAPAPRHRAQSRRSRSPRPTTTRSIPARSRLRSALQKPAALTRASTCRGLPLPHLERDRLALGPRRPAEPRIASRPSAPATSASRGSYSLISGCSVPSPPRLHRADWRRPGRSARALRAPTLSKATRSARPSRAALAAATPRAAGEVSVAMTERLGHLVGDRQRDSAGACADLEHRLGRGPSATSTSSSVSGRGIRTRRSTSSSIRRKPLTAEDVGDRFALDPAADHRRELRAARSGRRRDRRRSRPLEPVASQQELGVQPRVVDAGASRASVAASERFAECRRRQPLASWPSAPRGARASPRPPAPR